MPPCRNKKMPLFAGKMKKSRKKAFFPLAKGTLFLYKSLRRAEVAQLVEQGTENPRVGSSILSLGTIFFLSPDVSLRAFFVLRASLRLLQDIFLVPSPPAYGLFSVAVEKCLSAGGPFAGGKQGGRIPPPRTPHPGKRYVRPLPSATWRATLQETEKRRYYAADLEKRRSHHTFRRMNSGCGENGSMAGARMRGRKARA